MPTYVKFCLAIISPAITASHELGLCHTLFPCFRSDLDSLTQGLTECGLLSQDLTLISLTPKTESNPYAPTPLTACPERDFNIFWSQERGRSPRTEEPEKK